MVYIFIDDIDEFGDENPLLGFGCSGKLISQTSNVVTTRLLPMPQAGEFRKLRYYRQEARFLDSESGSGGGRA